MVLRTSPQPGLSIAQELTCPYCAGAYVAAWLESHPGYGTLRCDCGTSPILDGVPWLARGRFGIGSREDLVMGAAVAALEAGDPDASVVEALLWSSRCRARRAAQLFRRLGKSPPEPLMNAVRRHLLRSVVQNQDLTYAAALRELRNGRYADYLYHRFANPSLIAAMPVMFLLRDLAGRPGARVLEVGGGTGHASFLLHRYFPELHIILTDSDLTNLYLARRFIAPSSTSLCVDAEARLPFADQSIDAVYCQDSFHYMREKADLVHELRRVVKPGGIWLFPHLHNSAADNPAPGIPLTPEGYLRLFSFLNPRMYSEESLLGQFHAEQTIDLSQPTPLESIRGAHAFTLLAGPPSLWRRHDFRSLFLRPAPDLQINRIYQRTPGGQPGPIHWPNTDLKVECNAIEAFLQRRPALKPGTMDRLKRGQPTRDDQDEVGPLIRDFALVPMPERYD